MSYLNKIVRTIANSISHPVDTAISTAMSSCRQQIEDLMVLQGRVLAVKNAERAPLKCLKDAEFKVFSQFGEDGILQYLIHETGITGEERTFIEFGVQNYNESNTRFVMISDHWRGMIIDGNKQHMEYVRNQDLFWKYDLTAIDAWIDRDNINELIGHSGFSGDIGILSVDIDGNDYWVWERIEIVRPVIVVIEWNSVFGPDYAISIPYDPLFQREKAHYSCLFWGASISALAYLAEHRGYALLGSNTAGNNLFFVRKDRLGRLKPLVPRDAYVESSFRDSRDVTGKLNFLRGDKRRNEILDLQVIDVVSGEKTTLRELDRRNSQLIGAEGNSCQ